MMKKNNLIKLLSLLLCAVMLLTSCGATDTDENPSADDGNNTPTPPPAVEKIPVSEMISGVSSYLGFSGNENKDSIKADVVLFDENNHETLYSDLGYFAVIRTRITSVDNVTGNIDRVTDTYTIKNVLDGKSIYAYHVPTYFYVTGSPLQYEFKLYGEVIIEASVKETLYSVTPEGTIYEDGYKITYDYYDISGTKLATVGENARGNITDFGENGDLAFTVNGRTRIIRDEKIIYEFVEGAERYLPEIYHESDGYFYVLNEIGSELFVQILDSNFICISEFQLPAKVVSRIDADAEETVKNTVYVLGDGNLLIQGIYSVSEGEEFDYYYGLDRFFTYTALFDIKTGEVTEINPGYIIKDFYSCQSENAVCSISHEHNLAEISVFDKQTLSEETSLVVLDNKGSIVATIPTMLKTQISDVESIRFIDETKFIFNTTVKNSRFVYHIDCKTQKMTLMSNDAVYMDGYFYTDRAIYSNSLEPLHRLTDKQEIIGEIGNGLIIRDRNEYKIFSVGAFGRANLVTVANSAKTEEIVARGEDYVIVMAEPNAERQSLIFYVYNSKGEVILTSDKLPTIDEKGDGIYRAITIDEVVDEISGITKTYQKAYLLR